jgi:hypothetical protein
MTESNDQSVKEAAEAIAMEASRLQRFALKHEFHFLGYLLEMVLLEAWREASGEAAPVSEAAPTANVRVLRLKA